MIPLKSEGRFGARPEDGQQGTEGAGSAGLAELAAATWRGPAFWRCGRSPVLRSRLLSRRSKLYQLYFRAILHPLQYSFAAVRRKVEVTNVKIRRQFGQLTLGARDRID